MKKPLTKALHTTRVVEAIARHLVSQGDASGAYSGPRDATQLFIDVLNLLGNMRPVDSILDAACIAACAKVLS